MLTDVEIAQSTKMKPIKEIASQLGLTEDDLELYGHYKAKISLDTINKVKNNEGGNRCEQNKENIWVYSCYARNMGNIQIRPWMCKCDRSQQRRIEGIRIRRHVANWMDNS